MPKTVVAAKSVLKTSRRASFTLVELLVVMAIIAILCAMTMSAIHGVIAHAARSRATSEIQAMATALDSYKADNGAYPIAYGLLTNSAADPYFSKEADGTMLAYQTNSQIIYQALSGQVDFTSTPTTKGYMTFRANQVGDPTGANTGASYVMDPWGYAYGYSTGTTNNAPTPSYPFNGTGSYDLWSTGGLIKANIAATSTLTNGWISNWH